MVLSRWSKKHLNLVYIAYILLIIAVLLYLIIYRK